MAKNEIQIKELDYGYLVRQWNYSEAEEDLDDVECAYEDIGDVAYHVLCLLGFTEESAAEACGVLEAEPVGSQ